MDNQPSVSKNHAITIDNRSRAQATGIEEVLSYGTDELCLLSSLGTITVRGKDLKIAKFNTADGTISFTGSVDSIAYDKKKEPLLKRIFK